MSDTTTLLAALENAPGVIIPSYSRGAAPVPEVSTQSDEMVRS